MQKRSSSLAPFLVCLVDYKHRSYYNISNQSVKGYNELLEEYKEMCRTSADIIDGWENISKNDLCRAYVNNKDNPVLQNAYLSAILYKYWNLISKYYYMSSNCATPEECYGWLVDSVACCVNLASWENPESSFYKDPNGPDKVINRCMKCARLTYYQFINRKKRKDDFGVMSMDELKDLYGDSTPEPHDPSQDYDISELLIREYILDEFKRKDYFVSFLIYFVVFDNVFESTTTKGIKESSLNLRKLTKMLNNITEEQLLSFSVFTELDLEDVKKAASYIQSIPQGNMRKKIENAFEALKHSVLVESLLGDK